MRTIWKFTLDLSRDMELPMPHGARILHAALDRDGVPQLWAEVDSEAPLRPRRLTLLGTGEASSGTGAHIATFQVDVDGSPYVFHLFDQVEHDPASGCLSALALHSRMLGLAAGPAQAALLILDIDGLKAVNDIHGHSFGERLIRSVADRMRAQTRPQGALVARIGGDEFAVLVPEGAGLADLDGSASPAAEAAERLRAHLEEPYRLDGQEIRIGFSGGLGFFAPGSRPAEAVQQAEEALHEAKLAGRGCLRVAAGPHPA